MATNKQFNFRKAQVEDMKFVREMIQVRKFNRIKNSYKNFICRCLENFNDMLLKTAVTLN